MSKIRDKEDTAESEKQLKNFIEKFGPEDQKLIQAVRSALRKKFLTANELVWDTYNFFVIGYSPTERPTDSIVSLAARANGVGSCFIQGARLPDPHKLLLGSGKQTRFIRLESAARLAQAEVNELIAEAKERKNPTATYWARQADHPIHFCETTAKAATEMSSGVFC